jgi:hypothetical protein
MSERAQVNSVEAIEVFRAKLLVFMSKARAAVEEVTDEARDTRVWLEHDRRGFWEKESRRRARDLEQAEQELFNARLSNLRTHTAAQFMAVERARSALRVAEEKRDLVKRWAREFENRAEPLAKEVEQLLTFLTTDLVKAAAYLGSVVRILDAYAASGSGAGPLLTSAGAAPSPEERQGHPTLPLDSGSSEGRSQ